MAAVIDVTTTGSGIPTLTARGAGPGQLRGAGVFLPSGSAGPGDNWVEIGVVSDTLNAASKREVLAAGYVHRSRPLTWQGSISLPSGVGIYLEHVSLSATNLRASFDIQSG
jgi:hypothetical protein